jgi:hypothetical protein
MGLSQRLNSLERREGACRPEDCPGGTTLILSHLEGEAPPAVPADAPCCPRCGEPHVLVIKEVIVTARGADDGTP